MKLNLKKVKTISPNIFLVTAFLMLAVYIDVPKLQSVNNENENYLDLFRRMGNCCAFIGICAETNLMKRFGINK